MGSVRQTAGRTLLAVKSSKGKGTRTTLPLVMKGFAVASGVNIFGGVFQKVECGAGYSSSSPRVVFDFTEFGYQDDYSDAARSDWQRLIQSQLMLSIHVSGCFNGRHNRGNVPYRSLQCKPARIHESTHSRSLTIVHK